MHYECLTHDTSGKKTGTPSASLQDGTSSETQLAHSIFTLVGPRHFEKALVLDFMVGQLHKTVSLRSVADSSVHPQAHLSLCPTLRLQPCSVLQSHLPKCTLGTNSHVALVTACSVFRSYSSKCHLKLLGLRSSKEKQLIRTQEQKHPKQTNTDLHNHMSEIFWCPFICYAAWESWKETPAFRAGCAGIEAS